MTTQEPKPQPTNEEKMIQLLNKINDKLGFFVFLAIMGLILGACSILGL